MQTLMFMLGFLGGALLAKMMLEQREDEFFRRHMLLVYSFGLLYFAKVENVEKFSECKKGLLEQGVPEDIVNDPKKLEDYIKESIKQQEEMMK